MKEGAPGPARTPRLGEFACRCGEILPPRTSRTGRDFECACGRKGYVEAGHDEAGNPVVKPVFTLEPPGAATRRPGDAPPPAAPPPVSPGNAWTCPCGAPIDPAVALAGVQPSCPRCGRGVTVQRVRASHSMMVSMRPVFTDPPARPRPAWSEVHGPAPDPVAPPPAPPPPAPARAPAPEPTAVFREIEEPAAPAPEEIVACPCGERLYAAPADVGRTMECPTCLKVSRIEGSPGALRLRPLR